MNKKVQQNDNKNKFSIIAINIIIIVTFILLAPLILGVRENIPFFNMKKDDISSDPIKAAQEHKKSYDTKTENIYFSLPSNDTMPNSMDNLISIKARNNGEVLFLYSDYEDHYGNVLKIAKTDKEKNIIISNYFLPELLLNSVLANDYTFMDFNDNNVYISNNKMGFVFDTDTMEMVKMYRFPKELNIYQCVMSNSKDMFAVTTDKGFFVSNVDFSNIKELISTIYSFNNTVIVPKYPVWSENDDYVYYTLYANDYINGAGRTPLMPGGNEQYTDLINLKFNFLNNNKIFYYYSSNYYIGNENIFKCGYFNINDKSMNEVIKSSVYYYDIKTGKDGNFIAALSNNGIMKKINIMDINSKKTIYSDLFDDIYEFSFSSDESKFVIHAKKDESDILRLIEIFEKE